MIFFCSSSPLAILLMINGSAMISLIITRGFNEEIGSWKTIDMSLLISPISLTLVFVKLRPSNKISPEIGLINPRIHHANVLFPQPDSPTMPRVSPLSTFKLTLSTARTQSLDLENRPPRTGKYLIKFLT